MKIGRNEPCPCGSGKKYKHCCLVKEWNKTYIFKVKLKYDKRIWRKIETLSNQTLDDLHIEIINAFEFDFDHLYAFFMSNECWDESTEYSDPKCDSGESADGITISELNLIPKQKFLYLYDFGDEWEFEVEFIGNGKKDEKIEYPRIIESKGKSPEQYQT